MAKLKIKLAQPLSNHKWIDTSPKIDCALSWRSAWKMLWRKYCCSLDRATNRIANILFHFTFVRWKSWIALLHIKDMIAVCD